MPNMFNHAIIQIELLINHHINTCRVVSHFPSHRQFQELSDKKAIAQYRCNMTQTAFVEIMFSLGQTKAITKQDGSIVPTKELIEFFSALLDFTVNSWESKLSKARHRKKGGSQFLANLQLAYDCPKK